MSPKVLVANRGEIAIRIFRSASELGWNTVAVYTENDTSHATYADQAVKLDSVSAFLDVDTIVKIAYSTNCTHVHPGYGFLSESSSLPLALTQQQNAGNTIVFIGPSINALRIASDKMLSRDLANSLHIPVAPGQRVSSADEIRAFSRSLGHGQERAGFGSPVIIKALDGGGGRGIRVVREENEVDEAFKRCLGESPSKQIFVEKALTGPGWKHIEIQVIGDGFTVNHLWERECSVQRRFQKIVEMAPSRLPRSAIQPLVDASLRMAKSLQYKGLGTFEFLLNSRSPSFEWVFLEINPRVQVEHTVTEEINNVDLVHAQLLLFSSYSGSSSPTLSLIHLNDPPAPPTSYAIQLRLNAEDPMKGFQLAPGTLCASDVVWPSGKGVRVDTWLSTGPSEDSQESQWTVGTDFDSLLAKIIVRGTTFEEATQRGIRALRELRVGHSGEDAKASESVKTNAVVLAGTLKHTDWLGTHGEVDTLWLERNLKELISLGDEVLNRKSVRGLHISKAAIIKDATGGSGTGGGGASVLLQPGTLFSLTMYPPDESSNSISQTRSAVKHSITITSIERNAFPTVLSGTFLSTLPSPFSPVGSSTSKDTSSMPVSFTLAQSTSASVSAGQHQQFELADPNNIGHVSSPMTGKIVELHSALIHAQSSASERQSGAIHAKSRIRKGEALLVISVMKMENVVVAPFDGYVERIGKGIKVGVVLGESMLVCVLEQASESRKQSKDDASARSRL